MRIFKTRPKIYDVIDKLVFDTKELFLTLVKPIRVFFKKKEITKLIGRETTEIIYVIGDSHTNFFSGEEYIKFKPLARGINTGSNLIPLFKTFHLGSALAYNLAKYNSTTQTLEKILYLIENYIPQNATLLLCFGEIDCRVHVQKQAEKNNRSYEEIIQTIIDNYFSLIEILKEKGFKVICWGAIPSQKEHWRFNPNYPSYGTELERNKITKIYNTMLEDRCNSNDVKFCSLFDMLINDDMTTKGEFISDQCHLSQRAMKFAIQEFLNKGIII